MICLIDIRDGWPNRGSWSIGWWESPSGRTRSVDRVLTMCGREFFGRQDLIALKDPNLSGKGYCRGCMTQAWGRSISFVYMIKPDENCYGSDDDDA